MMRRVLFHRFSTVLSVPYRIIVGFGSCSSLLFRAFLIKTVNIPALNPSSPPGFNGNGRFLSFLHFPSVSALSASFINFKPVLP